MKQRNTFHSEFKKIVSLLILTFAFVLSTFSQDTITEKKMNSSDFESIIRYTAEDSIYTDFKKKQLHLVGKAHLFYDDFDMQASYILVDLGKKEILARYSTDSLGNKIDSPLFVDNGDTIRAGTIRYNYETKKGYIQEVAIQQEELFLSMGTAKRQANEEIHFINGKFTTCNLEEPHFHFKLSRAVLIPEKRIVSGPMNLYVLGIPTPIGLPFAIIPQRKERDKNHGFLMPQYSFTSPYGMGLQDLGYYIPINDHWQTSVFGTAFTRGSFGVKNKTEYAYKYRFTGNVEVSYSRFRLGWPNTKDRANNFEVLWSHVQDAKAHPFWTFGSNINFKSSGNNSINLQNNNPNYFDNTLNSDIRLGRRFKKIPISADMKLSLRQNSIQASQNANNVDFTSPVFNVQTTQRIYPFKKINKLFGLSYSGEFQNKTSFKNSYLTSQHFDSIAQNYRNGAVQRFSLQGTISLLKGTIRLTPSVNYNQFYNFQQIQKSYDAISNTVLVDTIKKGVFNHSFASSMAVSTTLYSYYRFVGKKQTLLRHILTPTVSLTYNPVLYEGISNYTADGKVIQYSQSERSLYANGLGQESGRIVFGANNTFELKQKSEKDTITGFKKTKIIDNFFINTDYDFVKDSMKWNDISYRLNISPNSLINITLTAVQSIYSWDDTTGIVQKTYAFETNQKLGRLKTGSISTSYTFTSKKGKEILANSTAQRNVWNPQYQQWLNNPNQLIQFDIPWKLTFEHIFSINLNSDASSYLRQKYLPNNTLRAFGDISITENWKISSQVLFDIENNKLTNWSINMFRNIHCWNVGFNWIPVGTNKNFTVSLIGNSDLLRAVNLNLRKPQLVF